MENVIKKKYKIYNEEVRLENRQKKQDGSFISTRFCLDEEIELFHQNLMPQAVLPEYIGSFNLNNYCHTPYQSDIAERLFEKQVSFNGRIGAPLTLKLNKLTFEEIWKLKNKLEVGNFVSLG
jgi:hypothetical protein